jgi:hypothetical protein
MYPRFVACGLVIPTKAVPLTDRLKDIELVAYFVNDFMAKIADMSVLTSETHAESGFEQLIQAIEQRMEA